jgi:hypothetical protein
VILCNDGLVKFLTWALSTLQATDEDLTLRLYTNDLTPTRTTAKTDFTEATFSGYLRKDLLRSRWGLPVVSGVQVKSTYADQLTWSVGATVQTVYGFFVCSTFGTDPYLWGERFPTPRVLVTGQPFELTPVFVLQNIGGV